MKAKLQLGLDKRIYLVFKDSAAAHEWSSQNFQVGPYPCPYCAGQYENAFLLSEVLEIDNTINLQLLARGETDWN